MDSRKAAPTTYLYNQLSRIGLHVTAGGLGVFIARAAKHRWSPRMLLEAIVRAESRERSRRSLEF